MNAVIKNYENNKAQIIEEYENDVLITDIVARLHKEGYTTATGKIVTTSYISKLAHKYGCAKRHYRKLKKKIHRQYTPWKRMAEQAKLEAEAKFATKVVAATKPAETGTFNSTAIAEIMLSSELSEETKREFLRWKLNSL